MDFHPDADRRALIAEAFSRPLDALLPLARLHRDDAEEPWDALAELGIFGLAAGTEVGGVGLGAAEEALLALELGRRLAGPQLLATLMALHCADEATQRLIVTGNVRVAPAVLTGETASVIGGGAADWWLLRQDGAAVLIPADRPAAATVTDDHHWTATLTSVPIMANSLAWVSESSILRVRLIEAAALCGLAACASEMAVAYAGIREQFGHPIGGFQAIKHHCANMAMAAMAARDAMTFAAMAVSRIVTTPPFRSKLRCCSLLMLHSRTAGAMSKSTVGSDSARKRILIWSSSAPIC